MVQSARLELNQAYVPQTMSVETRTLSYVPQTMSVEARTLSYVPQTLSVWRLALCHMYHRHCQCGDSHSVTSDCVTRTIALY